MAEVHLHLPQLVTECVSQGLLTLRLWVGVQTCFAEPTPPRPEYLPIDPDTHVPLDVFITFPSGFQFRAFGLVIKFPEVRAFQRPCQCDEVSGGVRVAFVYDYCT